MTNPIPFDELTRETWITAQAALALDELVEKSVLTGPLIVADKPAIKALIVDGRERGFDEPTQQELASAVQAIERRF